MTVTRSAAALTMVLGLGAVTAAASSPAQATAPATTVAAVTTSACTQYVVVSTQPVTIYVDPEENPYNESFYKLAIGQVFCAYGTNSSNTRFQMQYYCPPAQCDPAETETGWVTNSPLNVVPLNCTARTLTKPATVYTVPVNDEAFMDWPAGSTFCSFGSNAAGDRYQVYLYCAYPLCYRDEAAYVGWVTSDPSYYAPLTPAAPTGMWASTPNATSIRLQWTDNSNNEDGFEIINGATTQRVGPNTTSYTWTVAAGTYMCFKIRSYNTAGNSAWHPSAQMDWVCATTPRA
jgi:hypothetical protein